MEMLGLFAHRHFPTVPSISLSDGGRQSVDLECNEP